MQLGLDGQRRIEKKKSFQTHMNWRTATAPKAGNAMGKTILKNAFKSEAPSTRAASSTSFGRAEKKLRMKRTIHGRPQAEGRSTSETNVFSRFKLTMIRKIGMATICCGIGVRRTTGRKTECRM